MVTLCQLCLISGGYRHLNTACEMYFGAHHINSSWIMIFLAKPSLTEYGRRCFLGPDEFYLGMYYDGYPPTMLQAKREPATEMQSPSVVTSTNKHIFPPQGFQFGLGMDHGFTGMSNMGPNQDQFRLWDTLHKKGEQNADPSMGVSFFLVNDPTRRTNRSWPPNGAALQKKPHTLCVPILRA